MLPLAQKTIVVSMRNNNKEYDVRIDRQSRWGNDHHMKDDSLAERNRVCDEYGIDLWLAIFDGRITLDDLDALYGKRLGCWCKPLRCHGDELQQAVEWAHELICKYERIKATYRRRRRASIKTKSRKKVSRQKSIA